VAVLKDIESRDPLSEISEQEKELLWTFRSLGFLKELSHEKKLAFDDMHGQFEAYRGLS
jgi:hypothetical protein